MPNLFRGILKRKKKSGRVTTTSHQSTSSASSLATSSAPVQNDPERRSQILASIRTALNLAEKCLDGCPIWGPKAAVAAVSESIETVQTALENEESIDDVVLFVKKTVEILNPSMTPSLPTSVSPELRSRILNHVSELESIRARTDKWTRAEKNLPKRLLDARRIATELEGVMEKIRQANELFIVETVISTERKAEDIQEGVRFIRKDVMDARDEAILDRLRPVTEAFHNTQNAPTPCLQGTREQLLSDIFSWFNNPDPSGEHVFWLNGLAGTGKSAVARTVADHVQEQGRLAATFFFSRNSVVTRAPSAIIPTIVYQLALCLPSIRPLICAAVDSDRHVRDRGVAAQAKTLLENMSHAVVLNGPFLVVLDALDECYLENDRQGGDAVPMLLDKFKSLGCIKFLITSRDEGPIRRMFDTLQSKVALHDIEKSVVQSDIHHYLKYSFAELARDRKLALPFPPARDLEELVRRAGSLFVYAATVVKWISAEPLLRLRQVLEKNKDEVPYQHKFLDDMYSEILLEAAKTSSNPEKHECALKNVISTVVLLQEPVCVSALAILAGEEDRTDGLLPLLSAVLLVDEPAPVRLFHPSFPEFVVSDERCREGRFVVLTSEGHLRLAARCLEVMNMHLRENICNIKDPSLPNTEVYLLRQTLENVAPAQLRYACKYWHTHLRLADVSLSRLAETLQKNCTKHLQHWLELLSLSNELPTAQTGMPLLLAYLRSYSERLQTSLVALLADIQQLLSEYRTPIDSHALHVYHSAAVTMPMCPLWKHHASMGVDLARLRTPRAQGWILHSLILEGHTETVFSVAFSPISQSIVSGSDDHTVRVWDASTGTERHIMHGHEGGVRSAAFSPDGQCVVSGSDDKTVRVWDATTGTERHIMHGHEGGVFSVAFSPNGRFIASGSLDKTVRLWDASTGTERHVMHGHESGVSSVAFSPDSQSIVSGSWARDSTVRVWAVSTSTEQHIMHGHTNAVLSVAFSPDSQSIVSGSWDSTVRIWDASTARQRRIIHGHEDGIYSVAFSPNGQSIVSGSSDKTLRVWDASTGTEQHIMHGHEDVIFSVTFSPNGHSIASGSNDCTVRVWDGTTDTEQQTVHGHEGSVNSVAFSPNGQCVVSGSDDHTARVWDASTGIERLIMRGHEGGVFSVAFSPNGLSIVSGSSDKTLRVWDASTGTEQHILHGHDSAIFSVAFSPDSQSIVSSSGDDTVRVWDAGTGTERHIMHGHGDAVYSVAFSPNGQSIIGGSWDNAVRVWDAITGMEQQTWPDPDPSPAQAPPEAAIVTFEADTTGWIWRGTPSGNVQPLCWLPKQYRGKALAYHGQTVCIGAENGAITILDFSNVPVSHE